VAGEPYAVQGLPNQENETLYQPVLSSAELAEIETSRPEKNGTDLIPVRQNDTDLIPAGDYDGFWADTRPVRGGRHSRRPGAVRPARLLVLLLGVFAIAVAGAMVSYFLLSGSAAPVRPAELPLAHYLNNVGATSNSNPDVGNLDGSGEAFSVQALAASGIAPGAVIAYNGVPFRWPDAAAGEPDNVTASGQALTIHGAGTTLGFLLTAGWGPAQGTAKVVYSDGSTQRFTLGAPDWSGSCPSASGLGVTVYTPYHNQAGGRNSSASCLYYTSVRLHSAQPVRQIVLPDLTPPVPHAGDPSLHIFAATIY
jgi:hypothetical protein